MNTAIFKRCLLIATMVVLTPAEAQEDERAVPLSLGFETSDVEIKKISVQLEGREVAVSTDLKNGKGGQRMVGWYVSTPQFGILGTGEEHLDKTFSDVRSTIGGRPSKPLVYQRGYFLGRDITPELTKAGLRPLPDLDANPQKLARLAALSGMRFDQWQGYVNYTWTAELPANASTNIVVRYRALPAFGLADVASDQFGRIVQQHCGVPEVVRGNIHAMAGEVAQVVIERFEVPIAYLRSGDVAVKIAQPRLNWLRARPLLTLVCGLPNEGKFADVSGTIEASLDVLSILVISAIDTSNATGDDGHGKR